MEEKIKILEEEFDKLAVYTNEYGYVHQIPKYKEIKSFISSKIAQAKAEEGIKCFDHCKEAVEEERERIIKLIKEKGLHLGYANDIINLIKESK